ncbi:CDP-alcohol phosphatidyltransferase family protein [Emticicia sp. BO119]|uniref:CDP-alcohol phosphatidyltransferase family protein n=1 Tax=Emticicia sp. BO119 TaxID=2757768 RepID=UPI0015F0C0CC|nr:CDP-alcohol phosphatidyltransferase family protein [Emticicia sp. BO119]MBA4852256.1 CDP-alcohol phosphatidyltransferase family protein [Emticicia sp. BO119]
MNYIPTILLYSRLVFTLVIILLSFVHVPYSNIIVLSLMHLGVISDIFDGIIARKLNISTQDFRVQDTLFDLSFYLSIVYFIYQFKPDVIADNIILISGILTLEASMYLISLIRFQKLPSPHDIGSKFWALYLLVEFSLLLLKQSGIHFTIALSIGLLVHFNRVLIYILLKKWDHDIPTAYHAVLLRKGLPIKRFKLFNG